MCGGELRFASLVAIPVAVVVLTKYPIVKCFPLLFKVLFVLNSQESPFLTILVKVALPPELIHPAYFLHCTYHLIIFFVCFIFIPVFSVLECKLHEGKDCPSC